MALHASSGSGLEAVSTCQTYQSRSTRLIWMPSRGWPADRAGLLNGQPPEAGVWKSRRLSIYTPYGRLDEQGYNPEMKTAWRGHWAGFLTAPPIPGQRDCILVPVFMAMQPSFLLKR